MAQDVETQWLEVYRKHRHDILNGLQLVQGYLQLQRYDAALESVGKLTKWLHSLSLLQSRLDAGDEELFRVGAVSPHVLLRSLTKGRQLDPSEVAVLAKWWLWLDELAAENGELDVGLEVVAMSDEPVALRVFCSQAFAKFVQPREKPVQSDEQSPVQITFHSQRDADS